MAAMDRREFLFGAAATAALAGCAARPTGLCSAKTQFHVFSKMFQPPVTASPEALCDLMAGAGFDGIQWTVRKRGIVLPENAKTELPRLCRIAESRGLKNVTICTDITSDAVGAPGPSPLAEETLRVAADCGISLFRPAYFFYDVKSETFRQSMDRIRRGFASLAALAERTGVKALYQNHSTWGPSVFGGLIWDIHACICDLDPAFVGLEYDPMHALYETSQSWSHGFDLVAPWIGAIDLKDYREGIDPKNPLKRKKQMCAAGTGCVPWQVVRDLQIANGVKVPYVLHFEYDFDKTDLAKTVRTELEVFKKFFA